MEKITVLFFEEGKVPKDADWVSAVILDKSQHNEAYDKLCEIQDKQ